MKILKNCLYKGIPVDIVIETLQRQDFKYASIAEKHDKLYTEEFQAYFNHNTHELIEDGSGLNLIYQGECFDGFSLETMEKDGLNYFVNEMIEKCESALFEKLGIKEQDVIDL